MWTLLPPISRNKGHLYRHISVHWVPKVILLVDGVEHDSVATENLVKIIYIIRPILKILKYSFMLSK